MANSKKRGPYAKGEARRAEILDRALDVFAERGAANMSMRAIAIELGVSHSAIQHYFSSVEEILLEVIALRDERGRQAGEDLPDEMLRDELYRVATRNTTTPGLTALFSNRLGASIEPGNEEARAFFQRRFAQGRAELETSINQGRADGAVPPGHPSPQLAALILAAFDGLQVQWLLDPTVDIRGTLAILNDFIGDARATPQHEPAANTESVAEDPVTFG